MTIETKFNVGDPAWVIFNNRVIELEIVEINTTHNRLKETTSYSLSNSNLVVSEDKIFPTKEDLLKSL